MDARKLGLAALAAALAVAAVLGWRALGAPAEASSSEATPRRVAPIPAPRAPSQTRAADAAVARAMPCEDALFHVPVGTELRYHLEVGDGSEAQSAEYALRLTSTRVEAGERVDSWQLELRVPGRDEPVDSDFLRRCSEVEGAEEPWMGVDFAGLSELLSQGWRWPARLQPGLTFGGELRRRVMDQTVSVERQHRVIARESVTTPAGSFDAWRVELTDRAAADAEPAHGTAWVTEGVGLVRLRQPTAAGSFLLELIERSAS